MTVIHRFLAVDYSTVVYALFNGFYEEFFFLGLLLSTDTKKRSLVLLFQPSSEPHSLPIKDWFQP